MYTPAETPLFHLHDLLKNEMSLVDKLILEKLESNISLVKQVAQYLIQAGGKRIRPLLTLSCARLFSQDLTQTIGLSAAVEMIHTATLLHDDVIDNSSLRRGYETTNAKWGNSMSVLAGDFLFSRAFELMVESKNLTVLKILASASSKIAEGEILQLSVSYDLNLSKELYFQIISTKTAALFAAACNVGGLMGGMDNSFSKDLYEFGYNLGMTFQIVDDILDYKISDSSLGKQKGNDFYESKVTLPIIMASQKDDNKEVLEYCFNKQEKDEEDFHNVVCLLNKDSVFDHCMDYAKTYADLALNNLSQMPDASIKNDLESLVTYSLNRTF